MAVNQQKTAVIFLDETAVFCTKNYTYYQQYAYFSSLSKKTKKGTLSDTLNGIVIVLICKIVLTYHLFLFLQANLIWLNYENMQYSQR